MKRSLGRPIWPHQGPIRLSDIQNPKIDTGGLRKIVWVQKGWLNITTRSTQKHITHVVEQTLRILQDIRSWRNTHMSLEDFTEIAEGVRSKLIELQIDTQKVDEAIEKARELILKRHLWEQE